MLALRPGLRELVTVSSPISCSRNKHTLPDLPYDYNALKPVISAEIMQLHHQKHHQAYVNNLNIAQEKLRKDWPRTVLKCRSQFSLPFDLMAEDTSITAFSGRT